MMDPLVEALVARNAYTPSDILRAIRYRRELIRGLERDVLALTRLVSEDPELVAVRAERDPPYEET